MLKKIYRLSSVKLRNSKNVSGNVLNIKIAKNNLGFSRFGFVISKKIDKRATARNSLKRKLSQSVEEIFDRIDSGWDIVFYPKSIANSAPKTKVSEDIREVFKKERILND